MARSRSLPSNLFEDPDFFERSSATQSILLGLVLNADDYGRGLAHTGLLARKLNKEVPLIEQALSELEACGLLQRYQGERQSYYCLCRWQEWETLSKPTPSRYPAPPARNTATIFQENPALPRIPQDFPGDCREAAPEGEGKQEEEGKEKRTEESEGKAPNVVPFPTRRSSDNASLPEQNVSEVTEQVAAILKLNVTAPLRRIVEEYGTDATLSLLGEADAAREWIDDQRRNRQHKPMTPAFFRNWLKREREECHRRQRHDSQQATGTTGKGYRGVEAPASHSGAEDPYQAFIARRRQELSALLPVQATAGGKKDGTAL